APWAPRRGSEGQCAARSAPIKRPTSTATASNTSIGEAPWATRVATRRSAACSSARLARSMADVGCTNLDFGCEQNGGAMARALLRMQHRAKSHDQCSPLTILELTPMQVRLTAAMLYLHVAALPDRRR